MANLDPQLQSTAFILAVLAFAATAWQAFVTLRQAARSPATGVDWPLALFAVIAATIIVTGWVATILASIGWFSLATCAALLFFFAALNFAATRRAQRTTLPAVPFSAPGIQEVGLGLLLILAALLYFRPHEYVLGGTDAGTYLNMAVSTASTGEFLYHDEWTSLLTKHRDTALREQPEPLLTRSLQFVGWYIDDADPTISRPQFFPFHPMLLAVAASLRGPSAALWVTPLWGVLDIAALYFLARTLFDKNVALLAALFLTLTPTQIFFARYPTTEPLTLLLLFVALLAFQIIWDDERRSTYWGLLGGAALGAALLTRIDLPVVLGFVVLGMGVRAWQRRWSTTWTLFGLTLSIFLAHMILSVVFLSWPYFWNTYLGVFLAVERSVWILVVVAIFAIFVLVAALSAGPTRVGDIVARLEDSRSLRWLLASATVALSAYAYFLRPTLEPATYTTSWPAYIEFPILNGQNWLRMGWYLTPFGLLLATAGLAVIFLRASLTRIAVVLGIGLFTTVQYVYNVLNTPYHIYTMRRYVPIVIPMLLLFAAVAILSIPMVRRRWITYTLRCSAVVLLVGGLLYQARFVIPQQDMAGSLVQLDALEDLLAPDAVIVIADPSTSTFADTFGVPLQFQYGHDIATLRAETADTAAYLQDVQDWAAGKNIPVQVLAQESLPPSVRDTLRLQPRSLYPFTVNMLMNTFDSFPSVVQSIHYGLQIYDVEAASPAANDPPLSSNTAMDESLVDIGGLDALYIDDGFYLQENLPGGPTMRWTGGRSSVEMPLPALRTTEPGNEAMLEVQAMIFRPAGVLPHPVAVRLNGQVVGQFTPTAEWETYSLPVVLSQATDEVALLEFETEPFVPAELGINADTRSLGFLIDWIKLGPVDE